MVARSPTCSPLRWMRQVGGEYLRALVRRFERIRRTARRSQSPMASRGRSPISIRARLTGSSSSSASLTTSRTMTGSGSMSTAPIATRDASASVSISWLISWVAYSAPSSVSAMRSTSAGVWRIQRDASTSDASISVIGWRTSWIVEAKNSSRTVSIRSVSADRASIVAPSMASLTSAIAPTMSPTGRSSSRKRWSARAISWRSNRNSVAIATGPRRCSNRIWAWARALASIASSSIAASPASPRGAERASSSTMASNRAGMWSATARSG